MDRISHWLYNYLLTFGFSETTAKYTNMVILLIAILVVIILLDYVIRKVLVAVTHHIAVRSKTEFDDFLVKNKVPNFVAHILPLLLAFELTPLVFTDFKPYEKYADIALHACVVVLILWITRAVLNTFRDYFKTLPNLKDKPIDSYIQVFMIFAWIIGLMSVFAIITGIPFLKFMTTLGAASAIILLIFRDTILGFVASIQVSINNMVHIGDWITFEKYGADGDVIEISLATVKVQNFDKTITTIPTYALISDSFRNWRGMMESNGRRIKRAVHVRQSSVRFVEAPDIEKLKKIQLLASYIEKRQADIESYNNKNEINKELLMNGRNLTNLGLFRIYLDRYLKNHPAVNKDMTIMVRQLAPTDKGLPLEVYAFSSDKEWVSYEHIMADIFDHIIASIEYFDLQLFELFDHAAVANE